MPYSSTFANSSSSGKVRLYPTDKAHQRSQNANMAPRPKTQADFKHFWPIQEWMETMGKIQADLQKELGWSKGKMNAVWHGQQYTQALIDELAPWLNAKPYELLMQPKEAFAIRQLRASAATIASVAAPTGNRTGTGG